MIFQPETCGCFMVNNGYLTISFCRIHRDKYPSTMETLRDIFITIQKDENAELKK